VDTQGIFGRQKTNNESLSFTPQKKEKKTDIKVKIMSGTSMQEEAFGKLGYFKTSEIIVTFLNRVTLIFLLLLLSDL